MSKFIRLTNSFDKVPIYINFDLVSCFGLRDEATRVFSTKNDIGDYYTVD